MKGFLYYKTMKDKHIIKCPKCGAEYTPSEIYIPNEFFSKEKVLKDSDNKIVSSNKLLNTEEEYICDNCGTNFLVMAKVSFETDVTESNDNFDDEYVSVINKDRIDLE